MRRALIVPHLPIGPGRAPPPWLARPGRSLTP